MLVGYARTSTPEQEAGRVSGLQEAAEADFYPARCLTPEKA